jgi:hypothetical protein
LLGQFPSNLNCGGFHLRAVLLDSVTHLLEPNPVLSRELNLQDSLPGIDGSRFDPPEPLNPGR